MAYKEFILDAAAGTRLIEVRHEMTRRQSVSRYRLTTSGKAGSSEFATLRKARAAFRTEVANARSHASAGSETA